VIETPSHGALKISGQSASPPPFALRFWCDFSPALVNGHRDTLHCPGLAELQIAQLTFRWVQIKISKNGRIS
jgi:hypothetical protein